MVHRILLCSIRDLFNSANMTSLVTAEANWQNFVQFRRNFLPRENKNFHKIGVVVHSGDQITRGRVVHWKYNNTKNNKSAGSRTL